MSVRNSTTEEVTCMFDSTTGLAFGPVFDTETELDDFLEWIADRYGEGIDVRTLTPSELAAVHAAWGDR